MEKLPKDLNKVLTANPKAKAKWAELTPIARRDFVSWLESAKQPETRRRRVESLPSRLASGKRRICCYAVVPMNLYKALNADLKAKAIWKSLLPAEKRDFIDWINSAKDRSENEQRIRKVRSVLSLGRRHR